MPSCWLRSDTLQVRLCCVRNQENTSCVPGSIIIQFKHGDLKLQLKGATCRIQEAPWSQKAVSGQAEVDKSGSIETEAAALRKTLGFTRRALTRSGTPGTRTSLVRSALALRPSKNIIAGIS